MAIESVPGTSLKYHLIAFDAAGRERQEAGGLASHSAAAELAAEPFTDVFLMSHGWKGDVPAARDQYRRWIAAMAGCAEDVARAAAVRPGFRPLMVGVHWPSLPWGDERMGAETASFTPAEADGVEEYARRLADTPAARAALETIFAVADEPPGPAIALPLDVREAYETLDRETGMGSEGPAAAPDADREPFDPDRVFREARPAAMSFGLSLPSRDDLLAPLRTLSFWKMKDRARAVGESGGNALLTSLQQAAGGRDVRFHLMGHSFGCIVVSAMLHGPGGAGAAQSVDSLALVQGALSLWSFCDEVPGTRGKPGYFRAVLASGRVRGPVVTTQSEFDRAVGRWYPLAAGVARQASFVPDTFPKYGAVGTFGIQGRGPALTDSEMLLPGGSYGFEEGKVYNLASGAFIREGGGFSGAHSDIDKAAVAHAVWEAVLAQR